MDIVSDLNFEYHIHSTAQRSWPPHNRRNHFFEGRDHEALTERGRTEDRINTPLNAEQSSRERLGKGKIKI